MYKAEIFKLDSNGSIRTWRVEVEGNKTRSISGGKGRTSVVNSWTVCKGKQGRTDEQQAEFEAAAAFTQKLARDYRRTEAELSSVPKSPMLAAKYEDNLAKLRYPLWCQPKLDGIRATISANGAFSREYQPHLNVEHITGALAPLFAKYPGITFDGELYNHDLREDFGKIASVVRKQNPNNTQRAEALKLIQYHIYDVMDDTLTFADRTHLIGTAIDGEEYIAPCIVPVVTHKVTTPEELDAKYGEYLQAGYEGQMVRANYPYEFDKRSKHLLKRKEFITAEFKLLRIEEGQGNWAGYAKRCVFALPDGRECGAGIKGTQGEMAHLLLHHREVSTVTIRHFTPTPDGMPRFPVAIDFHLEGRND